MSEPMILTGDQNVPAMPMTEAQVNHLRRLLAWMRCEWTLDEDMQRGYLSGAHDAVALGISSPERASAIVQEKAEQINRCPAYVRQAVKMLTKALREHEKRSGVVDAADLGLTPEILRKTHGDGKRATPEDFARLGTTPKDTHGNR